MANNRADAWRRIPGIVSVNTLSALGFGDKSVKSGVANHNEGDSEFGSALRPKFPPLIRSRDYGRMVVRWAISWKPFIIWGLGQKRKER